jgi:NhaA family Na+:H+ antiporter
VGLIVGKLIGIAGATWLLVKLKWAQLPQGLSMQHIIATGFLGAIGFTMSLFIAGLAFNDADTVMQAKVGVLFASIIASLIGYFWLLRLVKKTG